MQQCNLHLVVCVNQSHYILRLARQWEIPIYNACARWAFFQISFRPQQEIEAKLWDGWTVHSGPSKEGREDVVRLVYTHYNVQIMLLHI